jgi:hypothetical protein
MGDPSLVLHALPRDPSGSSRRLPHDDYLPGVKKSGGPKRSWESLRDWQQRSRETAAANARERGRQPLKRQPGQGATPRMSRKRPPGPQPGPLEPGEWRREVWRLDRGRSILSGAEVHRDASPIIWQAHHPLAKRFLPAELKYDPRNGVVLLTLEHKRHEHRFRGRDGRSHVVPLETLPARCLAFAVELDERGVLDESAVELLKRSHPPAGSWQTTEEVSSA